MKKILLIEDDSNYIWHIKNFLQRKGYHVLVAFTVSQGKELIEKEQILIIGSDLKLSDGSGMLRQVAGFRHFYNKKIIFLSRKI